MKTRPQTITDDQVISVNDKVKFEGNYYRVVSISADGRTATITSKHPRFVVRVGYVCAFSVDMKKLKLHRLAR